MNSTFAVPETNARLPYVPELPADFVMMLNLERAKDDVARHQTTHRGMDRAAA